LSAKGGGRTTPRSDNEPDAAPRRHILQAIAGTGIGVAIFLAAGLIWFATPPAPDSRATPTDAIVVLTGGSLRLQSGVDLMREGKGRALFVSGVNRRVDLDELLRISGDAPPWLSCCIAVGYRARNTEQNALETARWMRSRNYRSLRLVTGWYHMPRSVLEFERAMPNIEIVPHPVFPEGVKERRWWARRGTAGLLIGEYAKYLAALFRPLFEPPQSLGPERAEAEARR
jgi:uncharacterized SAM-binding protein YcdF (DUF218 family)